MRRLATAVLTVLLPSLLVLLPATSVQAADVDCADFATQAAAQKWFLDHDPKNDPAALDSDGDLLACESNPCPCSTSTTATGGGPVTLRQRGRVTHVVDGDTVDVRLRATGTVKRVRMLGIDTPEVYGGEECGGRAASRSLKRMLPVGTRVRLVSDPTQDRRDRYGRLLRYVVKVSTGKDVDYAQVWRGHARVYVYNSNPFKRVAVYRTAQRSAKDAGRGLWGAC